MRRALRALRRGRVGFLFLTAVWFALVAALVEVGALEAQAVLRGDFVWSNPEAAWMTPLAYTFFLVLCALILAVLRPFTRRAFGLGWSVFAFGSLATAGMVFLFRRLYIPASLVLALGVGAAASRLASRHPRAFRRLVVLTFPWLAGLHLVVALGVESGEVFRDDLGVYRSPPPADLPDVLLIVLDTVRAQDLSLYGYERPTSPNLERLARDGVTFEWAFSPSPWTLPAHASMFTGRYPDRFQADWLRPFGDTFPTLAEALRDRGYLTAGFTANYLYTTRESGLDRGFVHYDDLELSLEQVLLSSSLGQVAKAASRDLRRAESPGDMIEVLLSVRLPLERWSDRKSASDVNCEFLEWLAGIGDRPFFAFLNYFDAHKPYVPAERFQGVFLPSAFAQDRYDAAIRSIDHEIGRLLDALRRRGRLDDTVIAVTSDHGEQFGEHRLTGHGNSLYLELLRVPLVIRYPSRVPRGLRVSAPVSLRDLPATLLELASCEEAPLGGRSLSDRWRGGTAAESPEPLYAEVRDGIDTPPSHPVSKGDMQAVLAGGFHYIRNGDGTEELYRYEADPEEENNLALAGGQRQTLLGMRRLLAERFAGQGFGED